MQAKPRAALPKTNNNLDNKNDPPTYVTKVYERYTPEFPSEAANTRRQIYTTVVRTLAKPVNEETQQSFAAH